jgi:type VI secretion system lysozyme-like protein
MSTIVAATHIPLFDRIAGFSEASFDGRLMDAHGLRLSLMRDLGRLFNARNGLSVEAFLASEPSVLDYGLPDLLSLSPRSSLDLGKVAQVVSHGIALYEPRLSHVEVKAQRDPESTGGARVTIAAAVNTGNQLCRVDFDVMMDPQAVQFRDAA